MFDRFIDGYCNPENELFNYICNRAAKGLEKEEKEKEGIKSLADWESKARSIRQSFIDSIGGLGFQDTDISPEYRGEIDKGEYKIKKVVFQSLPGFYVTANLYIPEGIKAPVPGILLSCGHCKPAKAEPRYQLAAIELALNKMAVLVVDPPGQGEIIQMPERHDIDWGVMEHSYIGLTCTLAGMNIARYFIRNLMKALDFLCSLEFVDENRIGACGNSGGGTQTSYISLVDPRIKAAAPGCYINGRKHYIQRGHAHDSEQNIYDCMNIGLDYVEFISCFAPGPFRVLSQQYDFFPIEGTLDSFDRAKRIYSLYGAEKNLDMVMDRQMHGLSDGLRNGLVDHFLNCFNPVEKRSQVDPYQYIESEKNLQCTDSGCVFGEIEGARQLHEIVHEDYLTSIEIECSAEDRIKKVFSLDENPEKPLEKRINPFDFCGYESEKLFWLNGAGISNTGILIKGKERTGLSIMLFEDGTMEIERRKDEILEKLKTGDVFVMDLSGIGAVKAAAINNAPYYDMYGTMHKMCNDLIMTGSSLMEMWINDIIIATKIFDGEASLTAYGKIQPAAIIASVICKKIQWLELPGQPVDFNKIMECRSGFVPELEVFGFAKYLDLDEILSILGKQSKIR